MRCGFWCGTRSALRVAPGQAGWRSTGEPSRTRGLHVGNLGHPTGGNGGKHGDPILDDLAGVHGLVTTPDEGEMEVRWGDLVQVAGRGKEGPHRVQICRDELLGLEEVDHGCSLPCMDCLCEEAKDEP